MKTVLISLLTFAFGWFAGSGGGVLRWLERLESAPEASAPASKAAELRGKSTAASSTPGASPKTASDPFARWEEALKAGKLAEPGLRRALLSEMARLDPERAWKMLMSGDVAVQIADIEAFALAMSHQDGRAAALFGLALKEDYPRTLFLRRALSAWLLEEPSQCLAWLRTQPEQLDLPAYLRVTDWSYNTDRFTLPDLEALIALHPENESFSYFTGNVMQSVLKNGTSDAEALAWLRSQPASGIRDGLWRHYIKQLAEKGDLGRASELVDQIADPRTRRQATSEVAARLAVSDPQAAMDYAGTLGDAEASRRAWQSAFASWAAAKPDEALAYAGANLGQLTPELLNAAPSQWADRRPLETLSLAARFPESPARRELMLDLVRSWNVETTAQKRPWLDGPEAAAVLSPADLQALRSFLDQRQTNAASGTHTTGQQINDRNLQYIY